MEEAGVRNDAGSVFAVRGKDSVVADQMRAGQWYQCGDSTEKLRRCVTFLFSEIQRIDELYVTVGSPLSSLPITLSRGRDVPLCIMLQLMDAPDRIFPRGPMGTLYREFLAQRDLLSDIEATSGSSSLRRLRTEGAGCSWQVVARPDGPPCV